MISIVLLALFLQSPARKDLQPTPQGNEQQQPPSQIDSDPKLSVSRVQEQSPDTDSKNTQERNNSEDALVGATWWLVYATLGLGAVGIAASAIGLCTLWDIRKQTKTARIAAIAARNSAKATLQNARSVINAERAWIETEFAPRPPRIDEETGGPIIDHTDLTSWWSLTITNHGRTAARIVSYEIGHCVSSDPNVPEGIFVVDYPIPRHVLLGPSQTGFVEMIDINKLFTAEEWQRIHVQSKAALIRATVHYLDVLVGEKEPHKTSAIFCILGTEEELRRLPAHNEYT